jgi:anti-sigma B factor antagonist
VGGDSIVALNVSSHDDGDTVTVVVRGDVDLSNADELERRLTAASATPSNVLVDMSDVEFIDSAGINALLRARRAADQHGQWFAVTRASALARELLEMTGVWPLLARPAP